MRPTYYFLSSIGTHVTIAASCPATALQASVSFITLSVNRLILGFVIPTPPLRLVQARYIHVLQQTLRATLVD
ncbi:MAG: hypothetical protein P8J22_16110 [Pseudomonadales bacterium]|nr:hypothetical protein [Pseudomonadales bacterium]